MRTVAFLLVAACGWQPASAQPFKCRDAAGKVTYSGSKCGDLGLKDAGEVRDRIQVTPAYRPPPQPTPPSTRASQDEPAKPPAAADAAKPERRCFTITLANGKKATRCNDKPGEE